MGSLLEKWGWHEWLTHSNFSFLIGASHPHELIETADELGYRGIGLCDFDGLYGIVRAHRAIEKRKRDGCYKNVKLFYGAEIHFQQDHQKPIVLQNTIVLFAQNLNGYKNLCQILSYAHKESKSNAYLSITDLCHSDLADIVAILPMRGLIRGSAETQNTLLNQCRTLQKFFSDRLFVAITRTLTPSDDVWIHLSIDLAQALGAPILLSQDAFFHNRQRKPMSDILHAIRHNVTVHDSVNHMFPNAERCLHSLRELHQIYRGFSFYERALRDSYQLAESFSLTLSQLRYQYPQHMIPAGYTAQTFLEYLTWQKAFEIYGDPLPNKICSLLEHELGLVKNLGFADYFLTVWDIVHWAKSQKILCQGRGSAANSAICFVLGITAVDPMKFDLLFERFISAERGDPPDIDVDFEHERREEVIQYIYRRFSRQQAAMVANVICFKTRGSIRATGLALGFPEPLIKRAAKLIDTRDYNDDPIRDVLQTAADSQQTQENRSMAIWIEMAKTLRGFPRHMGIHSGGFIISDQPLNHLIPQEPATMPGRTVVQWSKEDIEALGFFKIDVLALGMLTAVRKTFDLIAKHYGGCLTLEGIPQDDGATYRMLQEADTVGTFQVESRAQMSMLPRLRPKCFYDLVVEVGIVRPGPIQGGFIHPYLKRRRGEEPITYPHPSLRPILERTMGVPIFQEQVMRMAMAVGDFTPGEADELRRQLGAWQFKGDLGPMLVRLRMGMQKKGIHPKFIDQVTQQIKGFAEYGFPESHATSFALIAYASCYLKCHFPAAFTVALLNSQPMGFYSPHALIQDAKRHGIAVLPICVQKSFYETTLELQENDGVSVYAIRLGFHLVSGLRQASIDCVLHERSTNGPWESLQDFIHRTNISRPDLTYIAAADALAAFHIDRRSALWLSEALPIPPLLDCAEEHEHSLPAEEPLDRMQNDFHATSTTLGKHPTELVREEYWSYDISPSKVWNSQQLKDNSSRRMVDVFGMVLVRQAPPSAKGMVFMTLEDAHGYINLVFDPKTFELHRSVINEHGFICAHGELQNIEESVSVLVRRVHKPVVMRADVVPLHSSTLIQSQPSGDLPLVISEFHQSRNYS